MTPEDSQNLADIRAYLAALHEQNARKAKETPSEQTSSAILQSLTQAQQETRTYSAGIYEQQRQVSESLEAAQEINDERRRTYRAVRYFINFHFILLTIGCIAGALSGLGHREGYIAVIAGLIGAAIFITLLRRMNRKGDDTADNSAPPDYLTSPARNKLDGLSKDNQAH